MRLLSNSFIKQITKGVILVTYSHDLQVCRYNCVKPTTKIPLTFSYVEV